MNVQSSGVSELFKGLTVSDSPATRSASHTHQGQSPPQHKRSQVYQSQHSTGLLAGLTEMTQKQHPSQVSMKAKPGVHMVSWLQRNTIAIGLRNDFFARRLI